MKPQSANRKIELKFMDISVKLTGKKNLENKAWSLLSALIQDRMRLQEAMSEMGHEDSEPGRKPKKRIVKPDIDFLKCYA